MKLVACVMLVIQYSFSERCSSHYKEKNFKQENPIRFSSRLVHYSTFFLHCSLIIVSSITDSQLYGLIKYFGT